MLLVLIVLAIIPMLIRAAPFRPSYPYDRDDWRERSYTSQQWAAYIESAKRIAAEPWKG